MAQRKEPIPDSVLKHKVTQQLANRGLRSPCRIDVDVRKGVLTMSGHVHYPHQRDAAMAAIRSVDGIVRVKEQIQIRPPVKHQYKTLPPLAKKSEGEGEAKTTEPEQNDASQAEASSTAAPAAAPPASASEDPSSTTDFDLGPAPDSPVERKPAEIEPAAANAAAGGQAAAEDDSSEMDFELGPVAVSLEEQSLAKTVRIANQEPGAAEQAAAARDEEPCETDFDLGPAPVRKPASAPDSAAR